MTDTTLSRATSGQPVHALPRLDVYQDLDSSPRGLTADEAATRLERYGRNELPKGKSRPLIYRFFGQFTDLFAIVLIVASAITFLAYGIQVPHDVNNLELAIAILGVVILNAVIGFFQEYSAEKTAEALQAMVPRACRVIRDGERMEVAAAELVPGDVVVLEAGDAVSCDCRLVEAHDLSLNNVALTGESDPVGRTTDPSLPDSELIESRNCVFMGTSVVNGTGKAVAFATGLQTEFGRIFQLTAQVVEEKSPLQRQVAIMAKRVSVVAIALGAVLFGLRAATSSAKVVDSFVFALGVMVALVPEGLPATLSVSLAIGVRRMARKNALIKKLLAVETLGSTTVICTDKTGTLTKAEMTLQAVWESGRVHTVTGVGYAPEGEVEEADSAVGVLRAGALCADAKLLSPDGVNGWRILGDTTEGSIVVAAAKAGVDLEAEVAKFPRVSEFPFDSDRKLMSTIHRSVGGYVSYVKGSPQELLGRCFSVRWNDRDIELTDTLRAQIAEANDAMAGKALRVLGIGCRPSSQHPAQEEAEQELIFLGLVGMLDPPRPEVSDAVAQCRGAGIRIIMVTGDYGLTAEAIARKVGIIVGDQARLVSGADLEAMDDDQLKTLLGEHWEIVFARVKPEHKMRVVSNLKEMGEVVAVTGDGVNDAPALKRADIGVAMGITGTDVAREAAVMVLLDDSFASIVKAVELGRSVYQNIRKFLIYLFSHNLAELSPILAATFVGFPLVPLTALQVLAIDLGSDVMPALALGAEPPEPGIMDRPPRPPSERLFSSSVVGRFLFLGTIQSIGVVFAFFWRIHSAHLGFHAFEPAAGSPYPADALARHVYREALTMTEAGIVMSQFFNGFAVRTDEQSVFKVGLLSNLPLVAAEFLGIAIVSCISYVPILQHVFHTAGLTIYDWLMLAGFGLALLVADELRKAYVRSRGRRNAGDVPPAAGRTSRPSASAQPATEPDGATRANMPTAVLKEQ
jgi:P-type Ca2+ transporter type 2C